MRVKKTPIVWLVALLLWPIALGGTTFFGEYRMEYSRSAETYGIGARDDMVDWSQHPCIRDCNEPMTCRYGLTIETYTTMSKACYDCPYNKSDCFRSHCVPADGNERTITVANRKIPGMTIEVCKGDRVLVDVTNALITETTTVHWHGMHQRDTAFMDGVPYVTQCPIMPGESFRYDFRANNPGTHFWHSHSGGQRADGLFGALIVRQTIDNDGHTSHELYDHDRHVLVLNDWSNESGRQSYAMQYQNGKSSKPSTILVNGYGRYRGDDPRISIPIPMFQVEQGTRHRFRLINAGWQVCSIYLSIEQHALLVVSADGADVEPVEVDVIRLLPGERYDFVLNANRPIDNYQIRLHGDLNCANNNRTAILGYKGAPEITRDTMEEQRSIDDHGTRILNPFDQGNEMPRALCVSRLKSVDPDDLALTRDLPDKQIYVAYDFYELDTDDYHRADLYGFQQIRPGSKQQRTLQLNRISFEAPRFPLQTQPELISTAAHMCNVTELECTQVHCACTHVLEAKLNSVVEFVIVDKGRFKMNHPMHLHGYYYRVLAMEKLNVTTTPEKVREWDLAGKIQRRFKSAPKKDTLGVPSGGYVVVRIHANNPGYWFFHCHYDKHAINGMALVLKVGEHQDFPTVPKDFPKCGPRVA